jgi:hypothetical protein
VTFLKAVLKSLSIRSRATGRSPEFTSVSPASSIRQRVRYSMGEALTVCLNFRAKVDHDMPARSASFCIVQPCAGSSCLELMPRSFVYPPGRRATQRHFSTLPPDASAKPEPASGTRGVVRLERRPAMARAVPASSAPLTSASPPCPILSGDAQWAAAPPTGCWHDSR